MNYEHLIYNKNLFDLLKTSVFPLDIHCKYLYTYISIDTQIYIYIYIYTYIYICICLFSGMSTGHVRTPRTCSNTQNMFFSPTPGIATLRCARQHNESWRRVAHHPRGVGGGGRTKEHVLGVRNKELFHIL